MTKAGERLIKAARQEAIIAVPDGMTPLGAEFEAALFSDIESLYEDAAMTMKQKMIEAMAFEWGEWVTEQPCPISEIKTSPPEERLLDAALAVMADPANWTDEMDVESVVADATHGNKHETFAAVSFRAVINHIRG